MFIDLLAEIQEDILSYCPLEDIKNLSLTNSEHYKLLKEYLFYSVKIPESELDNASGKLENERKLIEKVEDLNYTRVLKVGCCDIPESICEAISRMNDLSELYFYDCGVNISTLVKGLTRM